MPKISELPPVGGINTFDTLPLVQADNTAKATFAQIPVSTPIQTALDLKLNASAVGTIASQNANNVAITGGSITGITDLAIADGGTGASSAEQAFTNLKQVATDTTTGVVELASISEVEAASPSNSVVVTPYTLRSGLVKTSGETSLSGSGNIDILGIPSWASVIMLKLRQASSNGTAVYTVQIGTSNTPEAAGYTGSIAQVANGAATVALSNSTAFQLTAANNATSIFDITVTLTRNTVDGTTWSCAVTGGTSAATGVIGNGTKQLAGPLDMIRLGLNGSANTWDSGQYSLTYW